MTHAETNICVNARTLRAARQREDGAGWSLADVAEQMREAGAAINPASLSRLEKGQRRPRYGEVVALARVFGLRPGEMAMPPEVVAERDAREAFQQWADAHEKERAAYWNLSVEMEKARDMQDDPNSPLIAESVVRAWAFARYGEAMGAAAADTILRLIGQDIPMPLALDMVRQMWEAEVSNG